jgi:hypothetical protein
MDMATVMGMTKTNTTIGTMTTATSILTAITTAARCATGTTVIVITYPPGWPSGTGCLPDSKDNW